MTAHAVVDTLNARSARKKGENVAKSMPNQRAALKERSIAVQSRLTSLSMREKKCCSLLLLLLRMRRFLIILHVLGRPVAQRHDILSKYIRINNQSTLLSKCM